MPTELVADASALAKLFLDEPDAPAFRDWWYERLTQGTVVTAPALLRYEIGNLITRNLSELKAKDRRRVWREALAGIRFDDETTMEAFAIQGLTFYDAAYVGLAKSRKTPLLTYDGAMKKAAKDEGVETITHRP